MRDLRLAVRRLAAAPLFTVFAVASLAVGVGVTTVAYGVVDGLFFQPVGGTNPERLALVGTQASVPAEFRSAMQLADFETIRSKAQAFSSVSATSSRRLAIRVDGRRNELAQVEAVSEDYFQTIGVTPAEGRPLALSDTRSTEHVALVSQDLASRHFGSNHQAVGRRIAVGGELFEIVGVVSRAYRGFPFGAGSTSVWVPLATGSRAPSTVAVFGRLPGSSTADRAASEVAIIGRARDAAESVRTSGNDGQRNWTARTFTVVDDVRRAPLRRLGIVFQAFVVLVLLVTSSNLANLVLARGTTRRQDLAVRRALGAGRWRIVREQLTESALIAAGGGLGASLVIHVLSATLPREAAVFANQQVALQTDINLFTLVTAATALLLCLVMFGLEPAMHATRVADIRGQLATGVLGNDPPLLRRQRGLVRWQVSVSIAFFVLAIAGVKAVFAELRHNSGVDVDQLVIAQLDMKAQQWDQIRARRALTRVLTEAHQVPGLADVELSSGLPFGTLNPWIRLSAVDPVVGPNAFSGGLIASTPGFFRATGIPIVEGRAFDERDEAMNRPVMVLSEETARTLFRATDAIGRQLFVRTGHDGGDSPRTFEVVGIARDTDTGLYMGSTRGLIAYGPIGQHDVESVTIVGRVAANTAAPVGLLEAAILRADDELVIAGIGTGVRLLRGPFGLLQSASTLALALGFVTLGMSMVGLFGIQTVWVGHRTREFGVRMSLGATAAQVKGLVLKEGARPALEGMAIGLFLGISARAIGRVFLDVPLTLLDPWTLILVPMPLVIAAFLACYLPARRAASVDPIVALREL